MAKKLTVEIDADVSKAKRKVREIVDTEGGAATGGGAGGSSAADKLANSLRDASKRTDEFAQKSKESTTQLTGLARAFTGFAIGMAATYASRQFGEDTKLGRGIGVASSAISNATNSALSTPGGVWTKTAAAAIGLVKGGVEKYDQYAADDKEKEEHRKSNLESIGTWEAARKRTEAFREELEKLTKCEGDVSAAIKKREADDARLAQEQRKSVGDDKAFAKVSDERVTNARELDALKSLQKSLKEKAESTPESYRAGFGANDALSRIGGDFGTSQNGLTAIERNGKEQLEVMKSIDRKTGVITWQ